MRRAVQGLLLVAYLIYAGAADGVPEGGMPLYMAVGLFILVALAVTTLPERKKTPAGSRPRRGRQRVGLSWVQKQYTTRYCGCQEGGYHGANQN